MLNFPLYSLPLQCPFVKPFCQQFRIAHFNDRRKMGHIPHDGVIHMGQLGPVYQRTDTAQTGVAITAEQHDVPQLDFGAAQQTQQRLDGLILPRR